MITYNNKYRGPFEYDKFSLNILSLHNLINDLETYEVKGTSESISNLMLIKSEIDNMFNTFIKTDGICDTMFLLTTKEKERFK